MKYAFDERVESKSTLTPSPEATVSQGTCSFCLAEFCVGGTLTVHPEIDVLPLSEESEALSEDGLVLCREIQDIRIIVAQMRNIIASNTSKDTEPRSLPAG